MKKARIEATDTLTLTVGKLHNLEWHSGMASSSKRGEEYTRKALSSVSYLLARLYVRPFNRLLDPRPGKRYKGWAAKISQWITSSLSRSPQTTF